MELSCTPSGFVLRHRGRTLLAHAAGRPFAFVGSGRPRIVAHRGNFAIEDDLDSRIPLDNAVLEGHRLSLRRSPGKAPLLVIEADLGPDTAILRVVDAAPWINRLWLLLPADPDEAVWGCGEQMSYLDLRGRRFRIWTSEPGVGRDKTSPVTFAADRTGMAGGDYDHTSYPQPTFLSSRGHAVHLDSTAHARFDFRHPDRHELEVWAVPAAIEFHAAPDLPTLVGRMADRFGRPAALPEWVDRGVILGLKRGQDHAGARLDEAARAGVRVAGLWCEDWAGVRQTEFGTRLFWDWRWQRARYPRLPELIARLHGEGKKFLGYVSPYLCRDGTLFAEAEAAGAFARDAAGGTALVDFGEFECGVIDFTAPEAGDWFRARILRREMLDLGMDGWMADFGEYLPTAIRLASGADPMLEHNTWPLRWAEQNARALAEAGRTGDALFFMRAGGAGTQAHCPLLWAGDQCVDFSRHDGLETAVCAALSAGLVGNACSHSDIGGYTSLFGLRRTPELFMRWAELAAFTPVMRTHEGNRPADNFQWWEDAGVTAHLARMTALFAALAPYRRVLIAEAASCGLPLMRPLFLHAPQDRALAGIHDQFLLGSDLLVAPVHTPGVDAWEVMLPAGSDWRHLWSGEAWRGGLPARVAAPLGTPPVFVRVGGAWEERLSALGGI
ncbi:MAG TPA: alpha-glucosidase [Acetobacteraceae bacterium]|nr:alpha-glucosidase [Acetobacteraceae bacterium]